MKNVLLDKSIILPSGEINKDKINLVAGAITQPLAEMVWVAAFHWQRLLCRLFKCPAELCPCGFAYRHCRGCRYQACGLCERQERKEIP